MVDAPVGENQAKNLQNISGKCGLNVEEGRIGQDKVEERKQKKSGDPRRCETGHSIVVRNKLSASSFT